MESGNFSRPVYRTTGYSSRTVEDVLRPGLRRARANKLESTQGTTAFPAHAPCTHTHVHAHAYTQIKSSMRVMMTHECMSSIQGCYANAPAGFEGPILGQGAVSIATKVALTGTGLAATYEIFKDYPSNFAGCRTVSAAACGTIAQTAGGGADATGSTPSSGSTITVNLDVAYGLSSYLVVVRATGYYTVYMQVDLQSGATKVVRADMVATLNTNQDRVVLSWGSSVDLDLWVVAKVIFLRGSGFRV